MCALPVPFCFLCLCPPPKPPNFKILLDSRTSGLLILQSVVLISSHFGDSLLLCPFFLFLLISVVHICNFPVQNISGTVSLSQFYLLVCMSCNHFFPMTFVFTLPSLSNSKPAQICPIPNLSPHRPILSSFFLGKSYIICLKAMCISDTFLL